MHVLLLRPGKWKIPISLQDRGARRTPRRGADAPEEEQRLEKQEVGEERR